MISIAQAVGSSTYPGRGILAGKSKDGAKAVFAYFIMGRSVNSRNRVFVEETDGMRTRAYDPSQMKDPSLIIYYPVRRTEDKLIVTNGDQTDTIWEAVKADGSFVSALNTRTFEPDAPNYTPRISAMATFRAGDFSLDMGILKAADSQGQSTLRAYYCYDTVENGVGYFLHTYKCDGSPIPSFEGEPEKVAFESGDADEVANEIWANLDENNKVSLWVESYDLATGECVTRVINRNV